MLSHVVCKLRVCVHILGVAFYQLLRFLIFLGHEATNIKITGHLMCMRYLFVNENAGGGIFCLLRWVGFSLFMCKNQVTSITCRFKENSMLSLTYSII